MGLLDIKMTAKQGSWTRFNSRKQSKGFAASANRIFQRDNYTCQYCGFRSEKFQEVVNLDQNYSNNKLSNWVTACPFCAQCFFIDSLEMDEHFGGTLIYLPEITQGDLNNFCRVVFCALQKNSAYKAQLQAIYLSLKDRAKSVETAMGPRTSEPHIYGQAILDCGVPFEQINPVPLSPIRLLPARGPFKEVIEYWTQEIYSRFPI